MTISPIRRRHLIDHCRRIAAIFDELLPNTALNAAAHRRGGVNPYHNRTTSGLYLEFYYGYPSKIWTPGGYWSMTGSTYTPGGVTADDLVRPFMARLSTELHEPWSQSRWGSYGPVYGVLAVDGITVEQPGPVRRRPSSEVNYTAEKAEWAALAEGWDADGS